MTDRSLPAPRRWKDAVWRRLDRRFARIVEVEGLAARLSELADQLNGMVAASEALEGRLAEVVAQVDDRLTRIEERSEQFAGGWDRVRSQALSDAQALAALYSHLSPSRPLPPLGEWGLAPDAALYLVETVLQARPGQVIECGSGTSTVLIALSLEKLGQGRLTSLEHDVQYLRRTGDLLAAHGLGDRVELVHAPLEPVEVDGLVIDWYRLPAGWASHGSFDLVLVDGPPSTGNLDRYPALPLLRPYLSDRALLVVDDASRSDEKRMLDMWRGRNPEFALEYLAHAKGTAVLRRRSDTQG